MALAALYSSMRQRTGSRLFLHVVVDDSVSSRVRRRLRRCLVAGDRLRFYDAASIPEAVAMAHRLDGRFSPAVVWRAWLPDYLKGIGRCILLDCDLIALMDIRRIWNIRLGGKYLSAFQGGKRHPDDYYQWIETPRERYFRMGICLMNLRKIRGCKEFVRGRKPFLEELLSKRASIPQAMLVEQSLYNRFFSGRYLPLPVTLFPANRLDRDVPRQRRLEVLLKRHDGLMLDLKGWMSDSAISLMFWSSLLHTPWAARATRQLALMSPPGPLQSPR